MTNYLVGTGGWAYFKIPNTPPLKAYSQVFNFVEVNYTFYEYPDTKTVERWRRTVPEGFTFAVRCHQDLTHRIGLKPVAEAYHILNQMTTYCRILNAPFLVLETPHNYAFTQENIKDASDFLSSTSLKNVQLTWETRVPITTQAIEMMQDFDIVHCADLSKEEPSFWSDVVYTRLFGKGKQNIYQFTDEELVEIDRKILKSEAKTAAASYHGIRMNTDAIRFKQYKETGNFLPVTKFTGANSVKAVLSEDARFPSSKRNLIEQQGWKVFDLTSDKRMHLSELLTRIPEKTYTTLDEVIQVLGIHE